MIRPICRMGNPILRKVADEVKVTEIKTESFARLIGDLKDSMKHYGGIGIAGPQIGIELKVCVIELVGFNRYGQDIHLPFTVFINPKIEVIDESVAGYWEGCLSVPGMRGFVERPQHIIVTFLNEHAEEKKIEAKGFLATVIQHELDHLFGKIFVDRLKDSTMLAFQEEFEQFLKIQTVID
jgi:peptide deformylase